jgi:uncharacterized protein (AIM24 family)
MNYDEIVKRHKIIGDQGSQYVKFKLKEKETIKSSLGSLIYMNGDIEKSELVYNGIAKGFMNLLAGETFLYQKFTGNGKEGVITFGTSFINSIICIKIYKGEEYRLSRNSFLVSTDNIAIGYTTMAKGILQIGQEEGFILPTAKCSSGEYGYIWLSSYGAFEKVAVEEGKKLIVNNGMFLTCKNEHTYNIEKLGKTFISSIGEGFGMAFTGPCTIFIQTKNINQLMNDTSVSTEKKEDVGQNFVQEAVGDMIGNAFSGGGIPRIRNRLRNL